MPILCLYSLRKPSLANCSHSYYYHRHPLCHVVGDVDNRGLPKCHAPLPEERRMNL